MMKFTVKEDFELPIEGGDVLQMEPGDVYEPMDDVEDVYPDEELPVILPDDEYTPDEFVLTASSLGYPQAETARRMTKLFGMTEAHAQRQVKMFWLNGKMAESIFRKGTSSQTTRAIPFDHNAPKNKVVR